MADDQFVLDAHIPDDQAWKHATPETISQLFTRALQELAYEVLQHENPDFRACAAREWPAVVAQVREMWERAAEKAIASAQSDLARQEGRLQ